MSRKRKRSFCSMGRLAECSSRMVREAGGKRQFTGRPERADRDHGQPKITSRKVREGENKCGLLYNPGWASLPEDTLGLDNREISLLWEDGGGGLLKPIISSFVDYSHFNQNLP